jgi:hypothetical protein
MASGLGAVGELADGAGSGPLGGRVMSIWLLPDPADEELPLPCRHKG